MSRPTARADDSVASRGRGFDPDCRACSRLGAFLDEVKSANPGYHCRPVAPFGDAAPGLLIVGLAPGMHGANATGRPFTGDHAGILLYRVLHEFGYASRPHSKHRRDGLALRGCRITNAVKCLPPQNKPSGEEIARCNAFLETEIAELHPNAVILALGAVAHRAVLRALDVRASAFPFAHGAEHALPGGRRLLDSYHCSRYNTQTRRLTEEMFRAVFARIAELGA